VVPWIRDSRRQPLPVWTPAPNPRYYPQVCAVAASPATRMRRSSPAMTRQSKLSILCILALATTVSAQWKEQLLYSFQGYPDGAIPVGSIVYDKQGNLYGATLSGGLRSCSAPGGGCGTVYELSPPVKKGDPWTETQVHLFQGRAFGDGSDPAGGLIMDAAGNLYGTTEYDGAEIATSWGVSSVVAPCMNCRHRRNREGHGQRQCSITFRVATMDIFLLATWFSTKLATYMG
jgi:hypothetical protein